MGLSFTDQQIKDISLENVQYPELKASAIEGKDKIAADQVVIYEIDQGNKQWTDFYLRIQDQYHGELKLYNDQLKTLYAGESLIDGAARKAPTHFPIDVPNIWVHLPPKMIDSQMGSPIGAYGGILEPDEIAVVVDSNSLLVNGFNDGAASTTSTSLYTVGDATIDVDDITGFSAGNSILVLSGSIGMYALIDSIDQDAGFCTGGSGGANQIDCEAGGGTWTAPLTGTLNITVLTPPSGNISSSASVTNFSAGYSNGEREGTVGLSTSRQAVLDIFKDALDSAVQDWETLMVGTTYPAVAINEDQKRKADTIDELTRIDAKEDQINTWQSFPSLKTFGPDVESRFGDIQLNILESNYTERLSHMADRINFIGAALDVLTQDGSDSGKGSFSGSGVYYDYFDWFNKRVNSAGGSLSKFYGFDIALEVIDQSIANLDSTKVETESIFRIEKVTADADGTSMLLIDDTSVFAALDNIMVVANDQVIINAVINVVGVGAVILDTNIPSDYNLGNVIRLVKEL